MLITGDFNLKDINWENYTTPHSETSPEYKFIECLRDNFLFQHVKHFTRCQNEQTRNILDLIITKNENNIDNIDISPSLGCSDHVTLVFDLIWGYISTCSGNEKYLYRKCDLKNFINDWVSVDWNKTFENHDVEEMWIYFTRKFDDSVRKHVPKAKPRQGCKPKPLWMTGEVLLHIKRKRHAWNKYLATRRMEDYEEYKRVRNMTNYYVKSSKRKYEKSISQKVKTEPKQFWRYVKSKTKSVSGVCHLKK